MTASLRDYLFTNHENGTRDKVNATQNKEILPPKRWKLHYIMLHLKVFEYDLLKNQKKQRMRQIFVMPMLN